jgi:hypothetical protein
VSGSSSTQRTRPARGFKGISVRARVVPHTYVKGDWGPSELVEVKVGGDSHFIYSWVVPPRAGTPGG